MTTCATCRFWQKTVHGEYPKGECRRFAPKSTIGLVDPSAGYVHPEHAAWPVTTASDFCGEFEAQPAAGGADNVLHQLAALIIDEGGFPRFNVSRGSAFDALAAQILKGWA